MKMATAWEMAKSMSDKHGNSSGIFVRLTANGDKVVGAFCGEPYAREVLWNGERYEVFDENNPAHQGKRVGMRVSLNFYVPAEGAMKVIEGGSVWFKDLLKVRDKYGLEKWLFEIERHGESGNPKTVYSILPEEKLDDALRADIAAAGLHDLEALCGDGREGEDKVVPINQGRMTPDGLIDPSVAADLVAQLRSLPRSDVDVFLAEFGVARVRDLDARDEAVARRYIRELLANQSQAEDIDPFA
jgi:hypothetical protein